ncbi:uncharacterized protein F4822DRAFT_345881 [Hypoxylon trugodes]|uniref:uncharacterized protein n=1 Tax=Hypoxylon trugodes TaxID=326681 RepID=UPI0021A211E8|nr:uncharacterized protein F4822DRAFT_345881 [Hypoxylon trugodes]KAI1385503.1 hypothetical protein F4822DRAFT_345881 [Hypoxylon trugodes]
MEGKTQTRSMGAMESYFNMATQMGAPSNHSKLLVILDLRVRFPPSIVNVERYISRAWLAVGRQYPSLAAVAIPPDPAKPGDKSKVTVGEFDEESWSQTFFVRDECSNVDALFSNYKPASTSTCYWLPTPEQIIIASQHWLLDGTGLLTLGSRLMSVLARVVHLGLDVPLEEYFVEQPLNPPIGRNLEDIIRKRLQDARDDTGALIPPVSPFLLRKGADYFVDEFAKGLPSIGLPVTPGAETAAPSSCSRVAIRLDTSSSKRLADACRSIETSVTSAVHAAIIRVAARYPQHPMAKSYAIFAPIDLRGTLGEAGVQEALTPMGVLLSGLPICVDGVTDHHLRGERIPGKDFKTIVRELTVSYSRDLDKVWDPNDGSGRTISFFQLTEVGIQRLMELISTPPPPGFPLTTTPELSSLGKVENYFQHEYTYPGRPASSVEVVDFWVGVNLTNPILQFHLWTWKDEITLSVTWNQTYYEKRFVYSFFDEMMEELCVGLEVDDMVYEMIPSWAPLRNKKYKKGFGTCRSKSLL